MLLLCLNARDGRGWSPCTHCLWTSYLRKSWKNCWKFGTNLNFTQAWTDSVQLLRWNKVSQMSHGIQLLSRDVLYPKGQRLTTLGHHVFWLLFNIVNQDEIMTRFHIFGRIQKWRNWLCRSSAAVWPSSLSVMHHMQPYGLLLSGY